MGATLKIRSEHPELQNPPIVGNSGLITEETRVFSRFVRFLVPRARVGRSWSKMTMSGKVAKNVPYGHTNRFGNTSRNAFFGENFSKNLEVGSYFRKASMTPRLRLEPPN